MHRKNSSDMTSGCCENWRPLKLFGGSGGPFFFRFIVGDVEEVPGNNGHKSLCLGLAAAPPPDGSELSRQMLIVW